MSAICDIKNTTNDTNVCVKQLKDGLLGTEFVDIATLCAKIDALEDVICDDEWVAPDCLAEPATATEMVVDGDQTANYQAGEEFTVYDDQGMAIGTADVVSSTYNAATNQTTVAYTNLQSTTAAPVAIAQVKAVKKRVAVQNREKAE